MLVTQRQQSTDNTIISSWIPILQELVCGQFIEQNRAENWGLAAEQQFPRQMKGKQSFQMQRTARPKAGRPEQHGVYPGNSWSLQTAKYKKEESKQMKRHRQTRVSSPRAFYFLHLWVGGRWPKWPFRSVPWVMTWEAQIRRESWKTKLWSTWKTGLWWCQEIGPWVKVILNCKCKTVYVTC